MTLDLRVLRTRRPVGYYEGLKTAHKTLNSGYAVHHVIRAGMYLSLVFPWAVLLQPLSP